MESPPFHTAQHIRLHGTSCHAVQNQKDQFYAFCHITDSDLQMLTHRDGVTGVHTVSQKERERYKCNHTIHNRW